MFLKSSFFSSFVRVLLESLMFEEATSDIFCDETECDSKVDGMLPYSKTGKDGINTSRKERALFCLQ